MSLILCDLTPKMMCHIATSLGRPWGRSTFWCWQNFTKTNFTPQVQPSPFSKLWQEKFFLQVHLGHKIRLKKIASNLFQQENTSVFKRSVFSNIYIMVFIHKNSPIIFKGTYIDFCLVKKKKRFNVATTETSASASFRIFPASNHLAQVSKKPEEEETLAPLGFSSQQKKWEEKMAHWVQGPAGSFFFFGCFCLRWKNYYVS